MKDKLLLTLIVGVLTRFPMVIYTTHSGTWAKVTHHDELFTLGSNPLLRATSFGPSFYLFYIPLYSFSLLLDYSGAHYNLIVNGLFRIPPIIGDIIVFYSLFSLALHLSRNKRLSWIVASTFFLNPYTIFISSIVGHAEALMMGFVLLSILNLVKQEIRKGAIYFALAVSSRHLPVLLLPIFMIYISRQQKPLNGSVLIDWFNGILNGGKWKRVKHLKTMFSFSHLRRLSRRAKNLPHTIRDRLEKVLVLETMRFLKWSLVAVTALNVPFFGYLVPLFLNYPSAFWAVMQHWIGTGSAVSTTGHLGGYPAWYAQNFWYNFTGALSKLGLWEDLSVFFGFRNFLLIYVAITLFFIFKKKTGYTIHWMNRYIISIYSVLLILTPLVQHHYLMWIWPFIILEIFFFKGISKWIFSGLWITSLLVDPLIGGRFLHWFMMTYPVPNAWHSNWPLRSIELDLMRVVSTVHGVLILLMLFFVLARTSRGSWHKNES